ncbi:hypothetical protein TR51_29645 [Kitasatospora griseola]|uniref:Uncharacterized protein n=1 Tax=Kitasatospora griseola TaxID=2064 RepID=A0A0D0PWP7_KITGR|nr:hypothetical protein TR51_29645 [Kitasatospora griseola]
MAGREARQARGDARGQQQVPAGRLVRRSGGGQLRTVHGLPDVVGGRAEQHRRPVELQRRAVRRQPVHQSHRHVVHQPQVRHQARWRGQLGEQPGHFVGQRAQPQITVVGHGGRD